MSVDFRKGLEIERVNFETYANYYTSWMREYITRPTGVQYGRITGHLGLPSYEALIEQTKSVIGFNRLSFLSTDHKTVRYSPRRLQEAGAREYLCDVLSDLDPLVNRLRIEFNRGNKKGNFDFAKYSDEEHPLDMITLCVASIPSSMSGEYTLSGFTPGYERIRAVWVPDAVVESHAPGREMVLEASK